MKRIYKTLALALVLKFGAAQTGFWTPTTYKGAFDCNTPMWTNGWTNWDPQNTTYPAATQTISSNITTNTTWVTGQTYLLQGQIFVKNNSVLTIQPGVVILGSKSVAGSGLFITTGSKLQASGTASAPIVFTSDQPAGSRTSGDWGGVILMGLASNNSTLGINNIEGLAASADTQYGGGSSPNDNDNSGTLQYVRIEFPGYVYQPNKEINGLTFGAVGRGTTIDHIQVSYSNDDAYEWFGGTVNCKYLVSFRDLDDCFDTDNGYSGNVQFFLGVRDPAIADNPAVSTSEGFESDNDPNGTAATPLTSAVFSNGTLIGPYRGSSGTTLASGYRRALRLRRNTNLKVMNSVFTDFKTGIFVDGTLADANAASGALKFKNNIIAFTSGVTPKAVESSTATVNCTPTWFASQPNDSLITTAGLLVAPYSYTAGDYRPVCSNTLINSGASFTDPVFNSGGVQSVNELGSSFKSMNLFPNPTENSSTLVINTLVSFDISVNITSVTGQIISTPVSKLRLEEGSNVVSLDLTGISAGIYFVNIHSDKQKEVLKLIINK